jgi:flagellar motor switch protein FliG
MSETKMTNAEKVAIIIRILGEEVGAKILEKFSESEIKQIAFYMSKMERITPDMINSVLDEFTKISSQTTAILDGGTDYVKRLLSRILSKDKVERLIREITASQYTKAITRLREMDPKTLSSLLRNEHPQTIAIIMANLDSDVVAKLIPYLPENLQSDVIMRMCHLETVNPEITEEILELLVDQAKTIGKRGGSGTYGGVNWVADVLNRIDKTTEQRILMEISQQNSALGEKIKKQMFIFDDLSKVDNRGIQELMKEITTQDLAKALKTASDSLKEKIFKNMSERAAEMLKEEIEFLGPIRLSEVEKAQQSIMNVAIRLRDEGKLVVEGEDDRLV